MKVVIVGGVAAGASAAARLRRLDEKAEIVLIEKGESISYANCGLPYHLGGVIADRGGLMVMPSARFVSWFNVDVRVRNEVLAIDRVRKTVRVRGVDGAYDEPYDKLLIATGSVPVGDADGDRVLHVWTLADMDRVAARLVGAKRATVVGAGFVGVEVAENLAARGIGVDIVQRGEHVLPNFDREMAEPLADELRRSGIGCRFGETVEKHERTASGVRTVLSSGEEIVSDVVIVCVGVRPNSGLASACGLECGLRGHIVVDDRMRTSDPDIYAAGDAVEVVDPVFGGKTAIALAGPASKQGRIAANNIAGLDSVYRGSLGASVVQVGRLTAGAVGSTETRLKAMGREYRRLYIHPASNAPYYPGGAKMTLKLLFGADGTIYGAQIVGGKGVDKRIDTLAAAMRLKMKAPELGELELAYAPPYSSAKDPVNFAGFVAENMLSGLSDTVYPDAIPEGALVLDVREPEENRLGAIPGAVNIRLGELRGRLGELDRNRLIVTCCQVGLRGYLAERILKQNGFRAANLSGGWLGWKLFHPDAETALPRPGPVLKPRAEMAERRNGDTTFI